MDYQVMPDLSEEEYAELKADIAERGVMVPVELDEDGNVLDGHHRLRACQELGITDYPRIVRAGMTEEEKRTHARKLNMLRRQLTREQKQELIRQQLRETPERSDRQIAGDLGVSHHTVAARRDELETSGQIAQSPEITGADGRTYQRSAVSRPKPAEPEPEEATAMDVPVEPEPEPGPPEEEPDARHLKDIEANRLHSEPDDVPVPVQEERELHGNVVMFEDVRKQHLDNTMKQIDHDHDIWRDITKALRVPMQYESREVVDAMLGATSKLSPDVLAADIERFSEALEHLNEIYVLLRTEAMKRGVYK